MFKNEKKYKLIFALVLIGMLAFQLLYKNTKSDETIRTETLMRVEENLQRLEYLRNFFSQIDTSFYGLFTTRSGGFHFSYLNNNNIGIYFTPNLVTTEEVKKTVKFFHIREVWKYSNENFYRFGLELEGRKIFKIIVLAKSETSFIFPENSLIYAARVIKDLKPKEFYANERSLYYINESVAVYLSPDYVSL